VRNPQREFDNTHLSLDQAEARGFIHRDYLAHCLRWSHVAKKAAKGYKTNRWLEIGCGKDLPLARLLYTSKLAPTEGYYLGVDLNKLEQHKVFENSTWKPMLLGGVDALKALKIEKDELVIDHESTNIQVNDLMTYLCSPLPTHIVSFEVLEHVNPAYCRKMLEFILELCKAGGSTAFISTPCYDAHVGAADNHLNEMTYEALGGLLEDLGFAINGHWGTFASQRDYKPFMTPSEQMVFDKLSEYYDSNLLAIMLAPLHPSRARNCLWELSAAKPDYTRKFVPLAEAAQPWSNHIEYLRLAGD